MLDLNYLRPPQAKAISPPDYNMVNWVETNRVLTREQSAETGLKKISRTPYLKPLYDWFTDDKVKKIIIQKPAQIGITDWVVDCILWIAANDPSPTALFLADQETARKIMKYRIIPALKGLGLIRKMAANRKQDATKTEVQLTNGFYLAVSWGSSISQTASMSFKRVFCDEVNKPGYAVVGEEGDTLDRISERMETFGDSKFILLSTPTIESGRITKEFNRAETVYDYGCKCPFCGTLQRLTFDHVQWEGGSQATLTELRKTARYFCEHCGHGWTDGQRQKAVAEGEAIARKTGSRETVSYQIHRLNSLFKGGNLTTMAKNFLDKKDDVLKLQNIVNSTFGEPWTQKIVNQKDTEEAIYKCRTEHAKLELPEGAGALVMGVDVQQNGFYYVIKAYTTAANVHLIDWGFVLTWDELNYIIFERTIRGRHVWRLLIDSGGTKAADRQISRTEEVYLWLRENLTRGVQLFAGKGSSRTMATKLRVGKPIEKTPSGKSLGKGVRIVQVNTEAIKDALSWQINATANGDIDNGLFLIPTDVDEAYIKQLTAEEKRINKRGEAEWVPIRKDNHYLDCEVYAHAAADPELFGGVMRLMKRPRSRPQEKPQERQQTPRSARKRQQGGNPYLYE